MNNDHSDFKWVGIMFIGIALAAATHLSISSWSKAIETKAAMENGYEQVIEGPTRNILWKKIDNSQN